MASSFFDDTVLDKNFSHQIELVRLQFSGNAHGLIKGIGLVNCVYVNPETGQHWVIDYRIYDPERGGKSKLDHERSQLACMTELALEMTGRKNRIVMADRGYFSGLEILASDERGAIPLAPKPLTSGSRAKGLFDRRDFIYIAQRDEYICPAEQCVPWRYKKTEDGMVFGRYWLSSCQTCSLKSRCTEGKYRLINRWEHEDILEHMQSRLVGRPDAARIRRSTVAPQSHIPLARSRHGWERHIS